MPSHVNPASAREFAWWVVRKLRDAGHEALWAGGCVRDELLNVVPSDYDVATSAKPNEVRECFGHRRTLGIGAAFGVVQVRGRRDQGDVEVATFRSDAGYSDGRHPDQVSFSTAREDAKRRDFTMNGLFYDPLHDQVIDYVGGRDDLDAGIVRAIGDPYSRIAEDKLRMLRAVRFAVTFGFDIEPGTKAAVRSEAHGITMVSAERIATELRKMLVHPHRRRAAELLHDVRLLQVILPESGWLWAPRASVQTEARAGEELEPANWENTLGILEKLNQPTFRVALAGLLWAVNARARQADAVKSICERWKLTNHEKNGVIWMLERERMVRAAESVPWPRLQRVLVAPGIDELLCLAEAIAIQIDGSPRQIELCRRKLELPPGTLNPPPLITGNDLRRAGFQAGPLFRRILQHVRAAQLEGRIATPREALEMAAVVAKQGEEDQ
ncbi:MAG: CCA tRNA nucleotidyltransferase [Planctomycetota bacterium]